VYEAYSSLARQAVHGNDSENFGVHCTLDHQALWTWYEREGGTSVRVRENKKGTEEEGERREEGGKGREGHTY
jgi:hypothetical protein